MTHIITKLIKNWAYVNSKREGQRGLVANSKQVQRPWLATVVCLMFNNCRQESVSIQHFRSCQPLNLFDNLVSCCSLAESSKKLATFGYQHRCKSGLMKKKTWGYKNVNGFIFHSKGWKMPDSILYKEIYLLRFNFVTVKLKT